MSNVSETPCEFNAIEYSNYSGPNPTRTWTRAELLCSNNKYTTAELNANKKKQLSYINNSANLTKQQKYSRIVRGFGPYANKVWATQGISYTNPNVFNLPLENNILACVLPPCREISLSDIATNDGNNTWTIMGNQSIAICWLLTIPFGTTLVIGVVDALTNNGTIDNNGTIYNNGTITNNSGGNINNNLGGTIDN